MKIFYQDYCINEGIDANKPIEADLEFALELFYELTDEEDNFFGIIDDDSGKSIQFMYIKEDTWLVDIPTIKEAGSWQKYTNYDECVEFIREFYESKQVDTTSFVFESYSLEGIELNEMLAMAATISEKEKEAEEQARMAEQKEQEWQEGFRLAQEKDLQERVKKANEESRKNRGRWTFID